VADTPPSVVRQLRGPEGPNKVLHRRWSVNWLASLTTSSDQIPCIVEDISPGGAKLRVGLLPQSEETVTLIIVDYEPIVGVVAWRSGGRVGLKFRERQAFVEELLLKAAKQAVGSFTESAATRIGTLKDL
jgi:hypothetical protein